MILPLDVGLSGAGVLAGGNGASIRHHKAVHEKGFELLVLRGAAAGLNPLCDKIRCVGVQHHGCAIGWCR